MARGLLSEESRIALADRHGLRLGHACRAGAGCCPTTKISIDGSRLYSACQGDPAFAPTLPTGYDVCNLPVYDSLEMRRAESRTHSWCFHTRLALHGTVSLPGGVVTEFRERPTTRNGAADGSIVGRIHYGAGYLGFARKPLRDLRR